VFVIPYFIVRISLDLTIKLKNLNSFKYDSNKAYFNTLILNYSLMYIFGLNFLINSKIFINDRKIEINPPLKEMEEMAKLVSPLTKNILKRFSKTTTFF
jgi:hypothetical protein